MTKLTLEGKTDGAVTRTCKIEAEKHFFDQAQPFHPLGFSVHYRNPNHWDVHAKQTPGAASAWLTVHPGGTTSARDGENERAFCIRGEPGNIIVLDERWDPHRSFPRESIKFRSVMAAMLWIAEELMQEPLE